MDGIQGSTLQQRQEFCNLRKGAHVPGYQGYIPQLKYRVSDTYGTATHNIAQDIPYFRSSTMGPGELQNCEEVTGPPLPEGHGNFASPLVPGYTGYIPRLNFKFGCTYGRDATNSIRNFLERKNEYEAQQNSLNEYIIVQPPMIQSSTDEYFRERLNSFKDKYSAQTSYLHARRPVIEPPIPGYTGYIPLIKPTETGLGARFHHISDAALKKFWSSRGASANIPSSAFVPGSRSDHSKRVYKQSGMIPLYTGYVPQKIYHHGYTYGETTRSLPVCSHNERNYGEFVKKTNPVSA